MERDIFIISVYCLVADTMQIIEKSHKFRIRRLSAETDRCRSYYD
jgi:hypothetical protein